VIIARAAVKNDASIRVLEKIGMKFWKYGQCEGIENAAYFKLDRNDFHPTGLG